MTKSRKVWVYLLKSKDEAFATFKKFPVKRQGKSDMNLQVAPRLAGKDNEPDDVGQMLLMGICSHLFMLKTGLEMMYNSPLTMNMSNVPSDVYPLLDNVDDWVRRSTCPCKQVNRYDPSIHCIMLSDEGEPLTYKEAKLCEHKKKWELAM